jgi:nitrite reductase/ring-hydroxylating ferredoxin subunit
MTIRAVCRIDELEPGEAVRLDADPPIAVFNVDGRYFATDDTCTHEKFSLADGFVDGDVVECPLHMARFCISTGAALCLPATRALRTYRVLVEDGTVMVDTAPVLDQVASDDR